MAALYPTNTVLIMKNTIVRKIINFCAKILIYSTRFDRNVFYSSTNNTGTITGMEQPRADGLVETASTLTLLLRHSNAKLQEDRSLLSSNHRFNEARSRILKHSDKTR
ncbi:hypothetical protein OUZ56_009388 [Daphnia magna]|uniref:Uncharacterized protein n=1 Tax=Daphnia magna TaxID=35525 RepID=A0ABR0AFT7_9CRUS|nr:hypothetical protein OUZ56_009388 [Daphnia magna]